MFNKLVKFHKMNVQIHSYRYCRVWNKKELGQMGLLKTPNEWLQLDPTVTHLTVNSNCLNELTAMPLNRLIALKELLIGDNQGCDFYGISFIVTVYRKA